MIVTNAKQPEVCDVGRRMQPSGNGLFNPSHPERVCWGCNKFCPADELRCGNGTIRTPHPIELFGEGWNADANS